MYISIYVYINVYVITMLNCMRKMELCEDSVAIGLVLVCVILGGCYVKKILCEGLRAQN